MPDGGARLAAISFDGLGTLIDREAGLRHYLAPLLARSSHPEVTVDAWLERWRTIEATLLCPYRPYRALLAASYEATMRSFLIETFSDAAAGLARSIEGWPPFADGRLALRRLARRYRLAIVANCDRDQLAGAVGLLQAPFGCLISAEEAGAYKPDPAPFRLLLARLGLAPETTLHVATSAAQDLEPARALGLQVAWLPRTSADAARPPTAAACTVASLGELADRLGV